MVPLRPVPADAPRPQPLSSEVIARALLPVEDALGSWFKAYAPKVSAEQRNFALTLALQQAKGDVFQAGCILAASFKLPVNGELMKIIIALDERCMTSVLRAVTREWVVRTGYRFPANDGDKIEWIDPLTKARRGGKVLAVDRAMAVGMVMPNTGQFAEGVRILAEDVVGNLTQAQYVEIKPILGQRYENAPALAAAYEAERAQLKAEAAVLKEAAPHVLVKNSDGSMTRFDPCPRCEGSVGLIFNNAFCDICDGTGHLPEKSD